MSKYAEGTEVPIDRSQSEIRRIVMNYGATEFMSGEKAGLAVIAFVACGKQVRFSMPLPDPDSPEFRKTPTGRQRSSGATNEAFAQEMRRRWRALALIVKAKLEAVETGIVSFEREFLPYRHQNKRRGNPLLSASHRGAERGGEAGAIGAQRLGLGNE